MFGPQISEMAKYDVDRIDNRDPERIRQVYEILVPVLRWYFRPVVRGIERVPEGPALFVGNHSGGLLTPDTFTFLAEVYEQRGLADLPFGLAHEVALGVPVLRDFIVPLGAIRAGHHTALRAFEAGFKVLVYPGSDYDAFRPYRDRNRVVFGPRRGYVRLALRCCVPIVPVVTAGGHEVFRVLSDGRTIAKYLPLAKLLRAKVWPIALSIPWGLTIGPTPFYLPLRSRFFQEVLPPIRFERTGDDAANDTGYVEACHRRVLRAMQDGLDRLTEERTRALQSAAPP